MEPYEVTVVVEAPGSTLKLVLELPYTSNLAVGALVPIPTVPPERIVIFAVLLGPIIVDQTIVLTIALPNTEAPDAETLFQKPNAEVKKFETVFLIPTAVASIPFAVLFPQTARAGLFPPR